MSEQTTWTLTVNLKEGVEHLEFPDRNSAVAAEEKVKKEVKFPMNVVTVETPTGGRVSFKATSFLRTVLKPTVSGIF